MTTNLSTDAYAAHLTALRSATGASLTLQQVTVPPAERHAALLPLPPAVIRTVGDELRALRGALVAAGDAWPATALLERQYAAQVCIVSLSFLRTLLLKKN